MRIDGGWGFLLVFFLTFIAVGLLRDKDSETGKVPILNKILAGVASLALLGVLAAIAGFW